MGSNPADYVCCIYYLILFFFGEPKTTHQSGIFPFTLSWRPIWSFTSFMLHLNAFPKQALFWNEALTVALIWTLITYYHFIRVYTNPTKGREI